MELRCAGGVTPLGSLSRDIRLTTRSSPFSRNEISRVSVCTHAVIKLNENCE